MCAPSPPPAPDYRGAAIQQGEANLEAGQQSSVLSNPNIHTPYGSQNVTYGDEVMGVAQPTVTQTFSPTEQEQFDLTQNLESSLLGTANEGLGRVTDAMEAPFDMSQVQDVGSLPERQDRGDIVAALMGKAQPYLDRNREETENQLLVQGHNRGGEAWNKKQTDLGDAESRMLMDALLASGQEQTREFGLDDRAYAARSAQRSKDLQEQAYQRSIPLNEINALRTGNQVNMPQFQQYQGSNIAAAPMMDATMAGGNFALQNYQNQLNASPMGGLFDLGGAALGAAGAAGGFAPLFSDRRLKENISRVGTKKGLPLYQFNYIGNPDIYEGFMADEVKKVSPDSVVNINGFDAVSAEYQPLRV